jgi:hypothetical protein
MAELGWTTSEVMQEHLQKIMSQGYMMAVDLSACRLLEDLIAPIQAGDMSWHALRSTSGDLVFQHSDFSALCCSSTAWNCIT